MTTVVCLNCGEPRISRGKPLRSPYCSACSARIRNTLFRKNNPEAQRTSQLKRLYGLSREQHEQMIKDQQGCCKICGEQTTLVVDHDHESNKIRSLLCTQCNVGLGSFKDSTALLRLAMDYLQNHR